MNRFTIVLLLFAILTTPAFSAENCSDIDDPAARLECFDRNFPRTTSPAPIVPLVEQKTDSVVEDTMSDQVLEGTPNDESIEAGAVVVIESEKPVRRKQEVERPKKKLFDFGKKIEISATIVDLLNRDKQRMVFKLDNDQIWIQTSPRNLPIKKGDNVTILSATMGGFIMRTDRGLSTRVSMLEKN